MVYLTKSQKDQVIEGRLFLALPCRNSGCGIARRLREFKENLEKAAKEGKDTHYTANGGHGPCH